MHIRLAEQGAPQGLLLALPFSFGMMMNDATDDCREAIVLHTGVSNSQDRWGTPNVITIGLPVVPLLVLLLFRVRGRWMTTSSGIGSDRGASISVPGRRHFCAR